MAADAPILEARRLTVEVAGRRLCESLSFTVETGQCWGLLGPNGSGKTTLLHTLAGLRAPASGNVSARGRPLTQLSRRARARHIGIMLQNEDYVFPVNALERVLAGRHPHLPPFAWETHQDVEAAHAALSQVDLAAFADRLVATLSGGERRRLQIAALLCQAPRLALLDEPENDLDLRFQSRLLGQLVRRFTLPHHAVLMVSHDVNLTRRHCSHLILLGDGNADTGPVAELGSAERLSALYRCPIVETDSPAGPVLVAR
jgi:iron complex transport system ATP-binding protein